MSEGWDSVTKIGRNVRSGGGAAKEKVVRSEKEVNAAKRAGAAVSTEKKFATGNQVRHTLSQVIFFEFANCFISTVQGC